MSLTNRDVIEWFKTLTDRCVQNVCEQFCSNFLKDRTRFNDKTLFNKIKRVIDKDKFFRRKNGNFKEFGDTASKKSTYTVQYEGEDETWNFPLLVDLEKGELIIIS